MMKDRAAVVTCAAKVENIEADGLRVHAALAVREMGREGESFTGIEVSHHLTHALVCLWREERAAELRTRTFTSDAEATAAFEDFVDSKVSAERDAWVKARLDHVRKALAPAPLLVDAIKAWPSSPTPAPKYDGVGRKLPAIIADVTRTTMSFGRLTIAPRCKGMLSTVSQGIFRPHRLFIEAAGDVAVPCEKCGHENGGRRLSDLSVSQIYIGCEVMLGARGLPAHLFTLRHADLPPPDPKYSAAGPGITIGIEFENLGRETLTFDAAMLGEYARCHGDFG